MPLPSIDDLFTSQEERDSAAAGSVEPIPLGLIDPFPNHPFRVADDDEMETLAESVAENGVLVPLTVVPGDDGRYTLVSGHRRKRAAELAGLAEAPCIVREMTEDEAVIAMVDSNLQRESILPSERAFAYSMRLEAMRRQGERTDLTCVQSEHKLKGRKSRDVLAEELGVSSGKVRRYIRLTHLVPGILDLVDEGCMRMLPAVEVSYLSRREQETLLDAMRENACTPSHSQALKVKRFSQEGELGEALIRSIMEEEKPNQVESFRIPKRSIARFFRPSASREEVEARVVRALELLEQAERKRAARGKGGARGQCDPQGQGLLHPCREHGVLRPRVVAQGEGHLLPDPLARGQSRVGLHHQGVRLAREGRRRLGLRRHQGARVGGLRHPRPQARGGRQVPQGRGGDLDHARRC